MKIMKALYFPALMLSFIFFSHCTPQQNLAPSTDEMLTHSNWKIDYFFDTQDLTPDFGGYQFLFSGTGAVAAQNQNETLHGTWNVSFDANKNEVLAINFNVSNSNLIKFNQQWKLTGKTTTTLQFEEMIHSPGSGSLLRIRQQ